MASIGMEVREKYPGKTDKEIAAAIAAEGNFVIVLRYKLFADKPYSNFGLCWTYEEADNYLHNKNLHDVEILFDRRHRKSIKSEVSIIVHNEQAVKRNIKFDGKGGASERCCENCRWGGYPIGSKNPWCQKPAITPVEVDPRDLCGSWMAR